ncbi:MAG: hypothetical protein ACHQ50_14800, partial [Fimbriimonadales bacterium]
DMKSEFKLNSKDKNEKKVRGYDGRDASLSHTDVCITSLSLTRKLGLVGPDESHARIRNPCFSTHPHIFRLDYVHSIG